MDSARVQEKAVLDSPSCKASPPEKKGEVWNEVAFPASILSSTVGPKATQGRKSPTSFPSLPIRLPRV